MDQRRCAGRRVRAAAAVQIVKHKASRSTRQFSRTWNVLSATTFHKFAYTRTTPPLLQPHRSMRPPTRRAHRSCLVATGTNLKRCLDDTSSRMNSRMSYSSVRHPHQGSQAYSLHGQRPPPIPFTRPTPIWRRQECWTVPACAFRIAVLRLAYSRSVRVCGRRGNTFRLLVQDFDMWVRQ